MTSDPYRDAIKKLRTGFKDEPPISQSKPSWRFD